LAIKTNASNFMLPTQVDACAINFIFQETSVGIHYNRQSSLLWLFNEQLFDSRVYFVFAVRKARTSIPLIMSPTVRSKGTFTNDGLKVSFNLSDLWQVFGVDTDGYMSLPSLPGDMTSSLLHK